MIEMKQFCGLIEITGYTLICVSIYIFSCIFIKLFFKQEISIRPIIENVSECTKAITNKMLSYTIKCDILQNELERH